ncbi:MAG TPA: enoyl-CoA hydratase-related protein [Candidatus Binataceae bacterium]|nr:enoyl-CoA hydratase-related protein [Candidatus Binataceae bacterium]
MEYRDIIYEVSEGVGLITLNRPHRLNAFTLSTDDEVFDALRRAEADDTVRVVIVTGAGRAFSAGADIAVLEEVRSEAETSGNAVVEQLQSEGHSFSEMMALRKPIIAAINGPCAGMAFNLAVYCDIRIAAESARMGLVFVRRGLTPEDGVNWILPRLVGVGTAVELQITGRLVDAREALRIGLVNHLVPDGQALAKAREIALDIAHNCSPQAVIESKRLAYEALSCDLKTALARCDETTDRMYQMDDFKEGVRSFAEGRPPRFTGR